MTRSSRNEGIQNGETEKRLPSNYDKTTDGISESVQDEPSLTRRGFFTSAGLAGLGLIGSQNTRAYQKKQEATEFENLKSVQIVGNESGQYDTIQAAHDDLPGKAVVGDITGKGAIFISESYDSSKEHFPVVIEKYVNIRGFNNSVSIYNSNSSTNIFEFNALEQHNTEYPKISNVRLIGGKNGIVIEGHTNMTVQDIGIWNCSESGIVVRTNKHFTTTYDNYFRNIDISGVGRDGVAIPKGVKPHSIVFDNVNTYRVGNHGYQLRSAGSSTVIRSSTIQGSEDWGILVDNSTTFSLRDCYLENNGKKYSRGSASRIDLIFHFDGSNDNFLVDGCYFNGLDNGHTAIHVNTGEKGEVRNCQFDRYPNGTIIDDSGHTDLNVDRSTITTDGHETSFYPNGAPQGIRTRDGNYISTQHLGEVPGAYDGDMGIHDGTNGLTSENPQGLALWTNGQWISQITGEPITRTITIEGVNGTMKNYEFEISGDHLMKSVAMDATKSDEDTVGNQNVTSVSSRTVAGSIASGRDSYSFSGVILDSVFGNGIKTYIDGTPRDVVNNG